MALLVDVSYRGIAVSKAYASIESRSVSLDKQEMSFAVMFRSNASFQPFSSASYTAGYDLDGSNPFIQAYEYLKKIPEFDGCTDC